MRAALTTFASKYPLRPDNPLSSSPSVDKLREVLGRAPGAAGGKDVEYWTDGLSGEITYYWSDRYTEQLFQALVDVIM
ncbi:uncharacterized protein PHACADRAFT_258100 [Phanerochaete carnosa HHB-10118-sp]|uniref:Uncharacterized protein n=1 Tax=Phanerochaete carnosa (strain HHB-10118-sp) TaxID=650164 RepID=K5UWC3_PHACS|nr:uncharacterized protein PHACADRAFT_258100 [Phanerochaete carnosa HHB-10118-sp]EKM54316.1 hypothetical protein PHACADRAFT_258100 [Phanerochaete carnosa HHB-10118-sp]